MNNLIPGSVFYLESPKNYFDYIWRENFDWDFSGWTKSIDRN